MVSWLALVGATSKSRDDKAIKKVRASLIKVGDEIKDLDQKLAAQFPEYASLANPQPLKGHDVQKQLQGDEALIYFMTSNQAVYIWALTNTDFAWHRVPLKRTRSAQAGGPFAPRPQSANGRERGALPQMHTGIQRLPASDSKPRLILTPRTSFIKTCCSPLKMSLATRSI